MTEFSPTGKRILLTGATGTLGAETALALARMGAVLLLPVRNPAKAEALHKRIIAACPGASLRFLPLDMAQEASVLAFAQQLCNENQPLDALIHNAGVLTKAGTTTPQGIEWHQQVNALSPALLTERLLPLLKKSSQPVVVTVTSLSAFWLKGSQNVASASSTSPTKLYASSKKLLLQQMSSLSKAHPDIRFVYAHPGVCATGLFTGATHQTAYNPHFLKAILPIMKALFPSPENACKNALLAMQQAQSGQLAEPRGLLHIWGHPHLVQLTDRVTFPIDDPSV